MPIGTVPGESHPLGRRPSPGTTPSTSATATSARSCLIPSSTTSLSTQTSQVSAPPRALAGETSRTPPPADRASRGPTTQRERTAEDGRDDEQRDEADLARDVGEREPARDPAERVDDVREREDAGERLEDLGHLGAGHGEAAQDELREERRRHELDGLELGARQGRRGETERAAEDRREHGAQHEYPQLAGDVHAAHPDRERDENERLDYREEPEGEGVARDEVALAERQAHEPLEGARGALAQRRDARDQEHHDDGEDADVDRSELVQHGRAVEEPRDESKHDARQHDD